MQERGGGGDMVGLKAGQPGAGADFGPVGGPVSKYMQGMMLLTILCHQVRDQRAGAPWIAGSSVWAGGGGWSCQRQSSRQAPGQAALPQPTPHSRFLSTGAWGRVLRGGRPRGGKGPLGRGHVGLDQG